MFPGDGKWCLFTFLYTITHISLHESMLQFGCSRGSLDTLLQTANSELKQTVTKVNIADSKSVSNLMKCLCQIIDDNSSSRSVYSRTDKAICAQVQ